MFVVFEGIDGAGTTTHSRLLCSWLESWGIECVLTAEPSSGVFGEILRSIMSGKSELPPDSLLMSYLFAADRREHLLREIEPALKRGAWVVCDRYNFSTMAYQGVELSTDWLETLLAPLRTPDVVVFLDVPVEVALQRIAERGSEVNLFEREKYLAKVRERYMNIFAHERSYLLVKVDTTNPIDAVQEQIRRSLMPLVEREPRGG